MLFEVGTFAIGGIVGPGYEVAVKLEFVRRRVEAAEDRVDQGPEVSKVLKGGLEDVLSTRGEFSIGIIGQKPLESIEILVFVVV